MQMYTNIHTYLAKDDVLPVEPLALGAGDEELAAWGFRSR